jgi:hypothetical protein
MLFCQVVDDLATACFSPLLRVQLSAHASPASARRDNTAGLIVNIVRGKISPRFN